MNQHCNDLWTCFDMDREKCACDCMNCLMARDADEARIDMGIEELKESDQ